jgi:hypothetical protein
MAEVFATPDQSQHQVLRGDILPHADVVLRRLELANKLEQFFWV